MPPRRTLTKHSVFDKAHLLRRFRENRIKELHAWNLWGYLVKNPGSTWKEMPNFPKAAQAILEEECMTPIVQLVEESTSADEETTKLLLALQDGLHIETVIMRYDTRGCVPYDPSDDVSIPGNPRATVCLSSQVGCRMGCTFCATGSMGLDGNLTTGEIVEQLVIARSYEKVRNIVFMGMGEPLDNYENVRDAVDLLMDTKCFGLAKRRITISTVGVHNRFRQLAQDLPGVSLAFSLHAPTQELRKQIVPSARALKLDRIMEELENYQTTTHQRIFIEYVLLADVNDRAEHAHQVGQLFHGKNIVLNLIPFNPVLSPGVSFKAPDPSTVAQFRLIVTEIYHIRTTVRQAKGQDIAGACGQLAAIRRESEGLELF